MHERENFVKNKIILAVAAFAGLAAAILTRTYLEARDAEYRQKLESMRMDTAEFLVYKADIPSGTLLTKDNVGAGVRPVAGLEGRAFYKAEAGSVLGQRTEVRHRRGEVVLKSDFERKAGAPGTLAAAVERGKRAISVNASGAAAVSGMIRPADHVDVIGTFNFPSPGGESAAATRQELVTMTILQNVTVLATGSQTAADWRDRGGAGYSTVTLLVTPREAEVLVFAEQMRGRISLTLRKPSDNSCESELPVVDFNKIRSELEELNKIRNKGHLQ